MRKVRWIAWTLRPRLLDDDEVLNGEICKGGGTGLFLL